MLCYHNNQMKLYCSGLVNEKELLKYYWNLIGNIICYDLVEKTSRYNNDLFLMGQEIPTKHSETVTLHLKSSFEQTYYHKQLFPNNQESRIQFMTFLLMKQTERNRR